MSILSPLDSKTEFVPQSFDPSPKIPGQFPHTYGNLFMSQGVIDAFGSDLLGSYRTERHTYSPEEVKAAWALIRSKVWLAKTRETKPVFVLTDDDMESFSQGRDSWPEWKTDYLLLPIEGELQEAAALGFEEKALRTLENIASEWKSTRQPVWMPYYHGNAMDRFEVSVRNELGETSPVAYGGDENEAPFIFSYLEQSGWIRSYQEGPTKYLGHAPTATGMMILDKFLKGKQAGNRKLFFVRKWDPARDAFFTDVAREVAAQTHCTFEPVWAEPHNERIDERILRQIRESPVVVLDVDSKNFNVGLEAGYALALGKPVVSICREGPLNKGLPFDIVTLNTYFYKPGHEGKEELIRRIVERVLIGLEAEKVK